MGNRIKLFFLFVFLISDDYDDEIRMGFEQFILEYLKFA